MKRALYLFFILILISTFWAGIAMAEEEEVPEELRNLLKVPLDKRVEKLLNLENDEGFKYRQGSYSEKFRKVDDETYKVTFTERTASRTVLKVDRYLLTLKQEGPRKWTIGDEELKDTYDDMRRTVSIGDLRKFDSVKFDREGFKVSSGPGYMYMSVWEGGIARFTVMADKMNYEYNVPEGVNINYYDQVLDVVQKRLDKQMKFKPHRITLQCDPATCEEMLNEFFVGLDDKSIPEVDGERWITKMSSTEGNSDLKGVFNERARETNSALKDNPFGGFRRGYRPDRRVLGLFVAKDDNEGIGISIDNFDPEEVTVYAYFSGTFGGRLFSYYSKDTRESGVSAYDLEQRPDFQSREYEVHSLSGEVDLALEGPELIVGKVHYGINTKKELEVLPYFISTIAAGKGEERRNPSLKVNSVTMDGEELTVIPTSSYSGIIPLPEPVPAGERINITMEFRNRGIYKVNHAFSSMSRGGWLPFVRFEDKIDEFELTVRTPSEYKTLGVGGLKESSTKDGVTTTHWVARSPVTFPTVIFGKYIEGKPRFEAKRMDGTVIPVTVHVDEVSMGTLEIDIASGQDFVDTIDAFNSGARGIRGKQLIPIAEQAANAINLYREISGLDYPFDELNLVNDPVPAMYGQAPASIVYLGSNVFRGEGTMAGNTFMGGGGEGTAKFLKSVVAHEVGHQWWGGIVNNANSRNYWFVESMAEFFSALWLEAVHGEKAYQEQVDAWRRRIMQVEQFHSVQRAGVDYGGEFPGAARQAGIYNKGPYAFHILRKTFGDEKFFPFLKGFCQDLAEKGSVTTLDIQRAAEKNLGGVDAQGNPYNVDLSWFFDQWIRGVGVPEFSFHYTSRQNEEGKWIIEGRIVQTLFMGAKGKTYEVENTAPYRGFVWVTVKAKKGQEFQKRLLLDGPETTFRLMLPERPLEVVLNEKGDILAYDVRVNR